MSRTAVKRALISVYDKTNVVELARALHENGVELVSTGSTAGKIEQAGVPVTPVEEVTGFPECLNGRVKTLHPRIHAGILADRTKKEHVDELAELGVAAFDLVVVNLYPFAETIASGASFEEGTELVKLAEAKNLMLGGAPDTFLGAGIQTCRYLIDQGYIGTPVGASTFMICRGHESWHPDPEFYYKFGGGPMLDMGPYYITALINLLGGVKGVMGLTKTSFPTRTITSQPLNGSIIDVDVATYVTGIMDFESGAIGTIFTTFDVHYKQQARFEVYGSEGTLIVPDPNTFGGPIKLLRPEDGEYREMPLMYDYKENSRGLGLADMAKALKTGREYRANYNQTYHVLEILTSFEKSSRAGKYQALETKYQRSLGMKHNPIKGILD